MLVQPRLRSREASHWEARLDDAVLQLTGRHRVRGPAPRPTPGGNPSEPLPRPSELDGGPEAFLNAVTTRRVLVTAFGGRLPAGVPRAAFQDRIEAKKREVLAKASFCSAGLLREVSRFVEPENPAINAISEEIRALNRRRLPSRRRWHTVQPEGSAQQPSESLHFLPGGHLMVCGPDRGTLWDPCTATPLDAPEACLQNVASVTSIAVSPDETWVVRAVRGRGRQTSIELWDRRPNPGPSTPRLLIQGELACTPRMVFSADGTHLAVASDLDVSVWCTKTGQLLGATRDVAYSWFGFLPNGTAVVWVEREPGQKPTSVDIRTQTPTALPAHLRGLLMDPEFVLLGVSPQGQFIGQLWGQTPQLLIGSFPCSAVNRTIRYRNRSNACAWEVAFSRDGTRVAVAMDEGIFLLRADRPRSKPQGLVQMQGRSVKCMAWSPEDTHLAILQIDGSVSIRRAYR